MLLRISLGIAILAGLGALYFSQMTVKPRIDTLTTERDAAQADAATAKQNETKAKQDAAKASAEAAGFKKELAEKSEALDGTTAKLTEQLGRANKLAEDLTRVTTERNGAQTELASWKAFGLTPDQIRGLRTEVTKLAEERDVIAGENQVLARNNKQLAARLTKYEGDEKDPDMPTGLKGKILAIDPRFDFVVLDIGVNQGVVERGKFLVSREGKLIGAVRVTRVEPDRCIANIISDYRQADIAEGDVVVH